MKPTGCWSPTAYQSKQSPLSTFIGVNVLQASSSAQGALMEAQQQLQRQLQQPPQGLQQVLRDAKASLPVLPRPPEPIKHALDALADAALGNFGE